MSWSFCVNVFIILSLMVDCTSVVCLFVSTHSLMTCWSFYNTQTQTDRQTTSARSTSQLYLHCLTSTAALSNRLTNHSDITQCNQQITHCQPVNKSFHQQSQTVNFTDNIRLYHQSVTKSHNLFIGNYKNYFTIIIQKLILYFK